MWLFSLDSVLILYSGPGLGLSSITDHSLVLGLLGTEVIGVCESPACAWFLLNLESSGVCVCVCVCVTGRVDSTTQGFSP